MPFTTGTRHRCTLNWTQYPRYLSSLLIHEIYSSISQVSVSLSSAITILHIFFSRHPCIVKLNIRSNDRRNYGGLPFFNEFGPVLSRWTRELGKRPLKLHCEPSSGSKRYRRTPTIPRYTTRSRQRSSRVSIVEIRSRPRFFLLVDEQQRDFISNRGKITIEGRRSEKRKMIDRSIGEEN